MNCLQQDLTKTYIEFFVKSKDNEVGDIMFCRTCAVFVAVYYIGLFFLYLIDIASETK